jgi:PAS domain S-box-containing protein
MTTPDHSSNSGRTVDLLTKYLRLSAGLSLSGFAEVTVEFLRRELALHNASIAVIDITGSRFRLFTTRIPESFSEEIVADAADSFLSECILRREPVYRPDIAGTDRLYTVDKSLVDDGIRSDFIVPLWIGDSCRGTVNIGSDRIDGVSRVDRAVVSLLAPNLAHSLASALLVTSLRESEARFRAFTDALTDGVIFHDGERLIDANRAVLRMYGYADNDREQLLGRSPLEFVAPKDRQRVIESIGAGGQSSYEISGLRRDGSTFPLGIVAQDIDYEGGSVRVVTARDLTETRRMLAALEETESRYRRLFETSLDAIYVCRMDGTLADVNQATVKLFGCVSKEEILSADIGRDFYLDEAQRHEMQSLLFAEGSVQDYPLTLRTKQGDEIHILETANVVRDITGRITGYQGIMRDVTRQRQLEARLLEAQRMEAVGRLAGGVAHDFNNLLTVINGFSELVLARTSADEPGRADLEEIHAAGQRAADLTTQLLAFSRRQVLQPKVLDLNEVLADFDYFLQRTVGDAVELVKRFDSSLGSIKADQGQLERVLINLATNACDAMPDGGKLHLETSNLEVVEGSEVRGAPVAPGRYVLLTVSDTGCGIDEETRGLIFEPFFTTKQRSKGSGLGLATVHGVVTQSGGYVWADSSPGEGATFKICLPRVDGPAEAVESKHRDSPLARGSETVLLVEDEAAVREFARAALEQCGYSVYVAVDALEARQICRSSGPQLDVMVTDVVMPNGNGVDLAREIKADYPHIAVLLISGFADRALAGRQDVETFPLLDKPFTVEALTSSLRRLLDG